MINNEPNPSELEVPDIPEIPENLLLPVQTLVRLAYMFRGVFMQAAEGKPLEDLDPFLPWNLSEEQKRTWALPTQPP